MLYIDNYLNFVTKKLGIELIYRKNTDKKGAGEEKCWLTIRKAA
jgi:hypothetical protein